MFRYPKDGWRHMMKYYDYYGLAHSSSPGYIFQFPFPISSFTPEFSPGSSPSFLKVRTKSCTLRLGSCYPDENSHTTCLIIDLLDEMGCWAGVVESLLACEKEYIQGCYCEVITISCGYAQWVEEPRPYQAFDEMIRVDEIKGLNSYPFYNVLWIEMVEGMAYRKAVGRVWKDAWEQQATKDVDIPLG
jgi:hypothetical protein